MRKDLNWHLKPISTSALNFIHEPLDILIDLTTENIFPLKYILGKSNAHFKVGKGNCGSPSPRRVRPLADTLTLPYGEGISKGALLDMMINTNEGEGVEILSKNILHYLKQINKVDGDVLAMLK